MRRGFLGALAMLGVAALVLAGLGCSGNNYSRSDTPVFLFVALDQSGEFPLRIDSNVNDLCTDITQITVESRVVGGQGTLPTNPYTTVVLTDRLIWFENDAFDVDEPGVNVPFPRTWRINGTIEPEGVFTNYGVPIVSPQMKSEPPLDGSTGLGYPIRLKVHVVYQGHMLHNSSERLSGEVTFSVDVYDATPGSSNPDLCL